MNKPACMDNLEYAAWSDVNDRLYPATLKASSACTDCIADFALEMRMEGRCDGHPRGYQGDEDHSQPMNTAQRKSADVRRAQKLANIAVAKLLYATGLRQFEVAKAMGLAPSTVCYYLKDAA